MPDPTLRTCRFVLAQAALLCVAALAGCAGSVPEPDRILTASPEAPSPAAPRAEAALRALEAVVRVSPRAVYDSGSSKSTRRLRVERSRPSQGPAGTDQWTVLRMPMQDGRDLTNRRSELTMTLTGEGDAVLLSTLEAGDGVVTSFEPGMLVMPANLEPGRSRESAMRMIVHPIEDPQQVRTAGDATVTIEHLGTEVLSTPLGPINATKVRSTLKAKLGEAQIENVTIAWYQPGVGMIAEDRRESVSVLGVVIRKGGESWVIAEAAPAAW